MPIPILKMKGLRRPGTHVEGTKVAPLDNHTSYLRTPHQGHARSASRTPAITPGGGGLLPSAVAPTSSGIPGLKGKDMRIPQPQAGRSSLQHPTVPAIATSPVKQQRIASHGNAKTPSHSRLTYRSQVTSTNNNFVSTSRTSSHGPGSTPARLYNTNERLKKYGAPKSASDRQHDNNNNQHLSLTYCGDTNSNRSSIISNCSSIPAPSSSSSNRNSSSSISSNFSVGSWSSNCGGLSDNKEPRSYPGASTGSDTFPRTNSMKRTKKTDQIMTKSMDGVDHRSVNSNNNSLQRSSTNRPRLREPQKIPSQMSNSESAIIGNNHSRSNQSPPSHMSESNLNKMRFERHQEGRHSGRSIPKPGASASSSGVLGKSKVSSGIPSHSGSEQRAGIHRIGDNKAERRYGEKRTARTIPQFQSKRPEPKHEEKVALVSPFASHGGAKEKINAPPQHSSSQPSQPRLPAPAPPPRTDQQNLRKERIAEIVSEEDDGYSSVVNTDQHDDDEPAFSSELSTRAEADEILEEVEPMKPLGGISSYSYLQSFREYKSRRSYPYCNTPSDGGQRKSIPVELEAPKWQFEQQDPTNSSSFSSLKTQSPPQSVIEVYQAQIDSFKPPHHYSIPAKSGEDQSKITAKAGQHIPPKEKFDPAQKPSAFPQNCTKNQPTSIKIDCTTPTPFQCSENSMKSSTKSSKPGLNATFSIPSEPVVKQRPNDEPVDNCGSCCVNTPKQASFDKNCNWMSRNTITGILPVVAPNRKYTLVGDNPTIQVPHSARPCPNLPTLTTFNTHRERSSEPRPTSLDSSKLSYPSRLSTVSCPSPTFFRSGSLRSPSRLLAHTPPPPEETQPTLQCNTPADAYGALQSFVRGSAKYSTVIPCTSTEEDPFLKELKSQDLPGSLFGMVNYADMGEEELRKHLLALKEKIYSLTEQLASSNKLVTAYEHSLTNMTHRLHQLTVLTENKETEVSELRKLLEKSCFDGAQVPDYKNRTRGRLNRGASVESLSSLASNISVSSEVSSTSMVSNNSYSSCDTEAKEKASKKRNWVRRTK